jgi:hypothetical protein
LVVLDGVLVPGNCSVHVPSGAVNDFHAPIGVGSAVAFGSAAEGEALGDGSTVGVGVKEVVGVGVAIATWLGLAVGAVELPRFCVITNRAAAATRRAAPRSPTAIGKVELRARDGGMGVAHDPRKSRPQFAHCICPK